MPVDGVIVTYCSGDMICHIDTSNGIPIYLQIERQVKFAIANKSLIAGEHVPSVRELATQAAVNVNTVARAYRELQQQGILQTIRGTGLAVKSEAPKVCRSDRTKLIRERSRSVVQEAMSSQISVEEIQKLVHSECQKLAKAAKSS